VEIYFILNRGSQWKVMCYQLTNWYFTMGKKKKLSTKSNQSFAITGLNYILK